jgi:hypothetical protein
MLALAIATLHASSALANPAHERMSQLSEIERRAMFAKFLRQGGERCDAVTRTFHQGNDSRGNAFWNVQCAGGAAFLVQVNNDITGSTFIIDCNRLEAMKGGTCFTKFK